MSSDSLSALVIAALVWDVPSLRSSDDAPAKAFLAAMSGEPRDDENLSAPLAGAAQVVEAYFSGSEADALDRARRLVDTRGLDNQLLGLMLLAWMGRALPGDWSSLRTAVSEIEPPPLKAHLLTKLFLYALDSGEPFAEDLLQEARHFAQDSLRQQLDVTSTNLYGSDLPLGRVYEGDDLVDYPWISADVQRAMRRFMTNLATKQIAPPGNRTQLFGTTPVMSLAIAQAQASWAGAEWVRQPVRQSLATAVILEGPQSTEQARDAVVSWVSSGGGSIPSIIDFLEPHFVGATADGILLEDLRSEAGSRRGRHRFVEAALSMWDLVSERGLMELLDILPPKESDHPTEDRVRRLWAALAWRSPDEWTERMLHLDPGVRSSIAANFTPFAAEALTPRALEVAVDSLETPPPESLVFKLGALKRLGRDGDAERVDLTGATSSVIVELLFHHPALVSQDAIAATRRALTDACEKDLRQAQSGSWAFGGADRRFLLGALVARSADPQESRTAVDILIRTALSAASSQRQKIGALQGLYEARKAGVVDGQVIRTVSYGQVERQRRDPLDEVEPDLLKAYLAALVALDEPTEVLPQLLLLSRAVDAATRRVAVRSLGELDVSSEAVSAAMLGALHDPEPTVVSEALGAISSELISDTVWSGALVDRLNRLARSRRDVRVTLAHLTIRLIEGGLDDPVLTRLRAQLSRDRSWRVSYVVTSKQ